MKGNEGEVNECVNVTTEESGQNTAQSTEKNDEGRADEERKQSETTAGLNNKTAEPAVC